MDPVIKDPGSKEIKRGCNQATRESVIGIAIGAKGCKRVIRKRVGYGWGCSPNVWLPATERGRGSPTFALYHIHNRIKQFYCIQYSGIHKCTVQRTVVRASRAAGDPRLYTIRHSRVHGVIPTTESESFRLPNCTAPL